MTGPDSAADFLASGGEMAELIRSKDWSRTPLGPLATWPQSLRTTVSLCLASNFPINIIWGAEHTQIYNDGYRIVCGEAHPRALGEDYSVTWASAWPAIGEPFARALAGETSFLENQRMFLMRNGYLEETFFTFSTSPIRDETGGIGGLFHPVNETTATMLAERRTRALRVLTTSLAAAATEDEVAALIVATLSGFELDLPFVLVYRLGDGGATYELAGHFGLAGDTALSPLRLPVGAEAPWPTVGAGEALEVEGLRAMLAGAPCGPYEEGAERAFVMPIDIPGLETPPAIVVAGISPRLPLSDAYRGFYELLKAAIGAALASVRAREDERRRTEALAAIDRAKTAFFSNVSHEFRTPLTLMLGPIEDVLAEPDVRLGAQRERLEMAHRNALRLLKLVNSLLDFSRIEAGRMTARFEPTDLSALTADLASNFRSACERAGLSLDVDCPPLGRLIHVDRGMWEKIVLNLMSNAFKFTLEGGISVRVREIAEGAELVVSDTGVGIPAGELTRVFERFHRIEGQGGRTHEGTGIGLSLVRELVTLHGGSIEASSDGRGSAFRVAIPAGTAHAVPDWTPNEEATAARAGAFVEEAVRWLPDGPDPTPPPAAASPVAGRPRVVLADDNADMRAYVRRILEDGGYRVDPVDNGLDALAAARRGEPPDLILSDVMMPGLDGFGLVHAARSDPWLEGTPIILLSARAGEEARVEGLASGADDYLVKPFSARELRARIDGAVRLATQRRESRARERDLQGALARTQIRQTEEQLEFALRAGRMGSWELDLRTNVLVASDICLAAFGWPAGAAYTREDLAGLIHPDDAERWRAAVSRAIEQGADLDMECRVVRPASVTGWILIRGRADYGGDGNALRLAGVSLDVTERKRAEERQRLLLDELNHRVKNTLATVQSIAMQTRRMAETPEDFSNALEARMGAMANAHDLLTRASWEGVSLGELVGLTLEPYAVGQDGGLRVRTSGPPVTLGPNAAVTLNMAFHELATNAAKYGALSIDGGRIDVAWSVEPGAQPPVVEIDWREIGGPEVERPSRRGFGSRLIEQGVARELGGAVVLGFEPEGLHCRMRLPASAKLQVLN